MKTKTICNALALALALSGLLLSGCTHLVRTPGEPFTGYAGQEKIHLKVGLNITDDLPQAKAEVHQTGDTWVLPVGGYVATNASFLARHCFDDVIDMNNGHLPANASVAAILTPRFVYAGYTRGAAGLGDSIMDVKIEWTLSDANGSAFWVHTVDGQYVGQTKTRPAKLLKPALEDLLMKSQRAISSAPAIRQFAQKKAA